MRAAFYTRQGPAREVLTLGEQPTPEPGPGEVRVRLAVSGANPSDWKQRKGGYRPLPAPLVIPHSDGAGVIDAVGDGVPPARLGERVWIWNGQWKRAFGTAAEFIALPSAQAVKLPDGATFEAGACLGIPVFTALQAVRTVDPKPGTTVLVAGGGGTVGHYAIQLAKRRGAFVLTTVSSDEKAAHARAAGADAVINYRTQDVGDAVREIVPEGLDAVIEMDLTGNVAYYPKVLKPHAICAVYGMAANATTIPSLALMALNVRLIFLFIYELTPADRAAGVAEITDLLVADALTHTIARRLPLERIAEAHDLVETGQVMGHILLDIG